MLKIFINSVSTPIKTISAISFFRSFRFMSLVFFSLLVVISCGDTTAASDDEDTGGGTPAVCSETFSPTNKSTLSANIATLYAQCGGNNASYNNIDVSEVTDMSELFKGNTDFNGDISGWDMSGVTSVNSMFESASNFNQNLSGWKLNAQAVVKDSAVATKMFYFSGMHPGNLPGDNFYQYTPTTKADLQTAITTEVDKQGVTADLSIIDTSGVTDMASLFANDATFNGYISTWVMSGVATVTSMFENATNFNQDLSDWVLKAGVIAKGSNSPTKMFYKSGMLPKRLPGENFYQYTPADNAALKAAVAAEIATTAQGATADLTIIDTSQVTDMSSLFSMNKTFNGYIATWDISNVENMSLMFSGAWVFNQPIANWDTSSVTNMGSMFDSAYGFNQPIENWDTSSVTDMGGMFSATRKFDQPIGNWKTGNVEDMGSMFALSEAFNQPLKDWDTSKVKDFSYMFQFQTVFNQNIKDWSNDAKLNTENMFLGVTSMEEGNKAPWMPKNK